jgi:hypothetical protein
MRSAGLASPGYRIGYWFLYVLDVLAFRKASENWVRKRHSFVAQRELGKLLRAEG